MHFKYEINTNKQNFLRLIDKSTIRQTIFLILKKIFIKQNRVEHGKQEPGMPDLSHAEFPGSDNK